MHFFQILTNAQQRLTNVMSMQCVLTTRDHTVAHVKLDTPEMDKTATVNARLILSYNV